MSFGDHLDELRRRILLSLVLPIPVSVVTFYFSDTLIQWLVLPLKRAMDAQGLTTTLQQLSPPEFLVAKIKLSLIAALIVCAPWVLWQAWLFISPGLYKQERRFVYLLLPGSAILTAAGVALMYFAMLPLMLYVLVGFGVGLEIAPDDIDPRVQAVLEQVETVELRHTAPVDPAPDRVWMVWPRLRIYASVLDDTGGVEVVEVPRPPDTLISQEYHISKYIGFVLLLFMGIVIAFQMPLVVLLLGWMGLATPQWLAKQRKYALLVCGVVSAIITPADVISMLVMLAPLYGLYELGILLLRIAPASKVAEGRVFKLGSSGNPPDRVGHPDKVNDDAMQTSKPSQPDETMPRTEPGQQSQSDQSDGKEDE